MVLDTDLTLTTNPKLRRLRWQLLSAYCGVSLVIFGVSVFGIYKTFSYVLNQQFNKNLEQMAIAAADVNDLVQHEYEEILEKSDQERKPISIEELMEEYQPQLVSSTLAKKISNQDTTTRWYSPQKKLIVQEGTHPEWHLFPQTILPQGIITESKTLRSFTLPTYANTAQTPQKITGYVQVIASKKVIDQQLRQLLIGVVSGGTIAVFLITIGGTYLTQQVLKPTLNSMLQLQKFTADAAHELRTPLTVIQGEIGLLQQQETPPTVSSFSLTNRAVSQMKQLVEDLLLIARIEGNIENMKQEWRKIPLDELLEDLGEVWEEQAQRQEITFQLEIHGSLYVYGDSNQLQEVFTNLLENAVCYTPKGGSIILSAFAISDQIKVCVEDTGVGIAPQDQDSIFDRFWRSETAQDKRPDGTGLGLSIAQTIIKAHNGQITLTSEVGKGSNFCVSLPRLF